MVKKDSNNLSSEKDKSNKSKIFWIKELGNYGISNKDYDNTNKSLTKKLGKNALGKDIIWSLFNEVIIKNINDYSKQSHIYLLMGNFIKEEGKNNPNQYYELSTKALLQLYKKSGIKKVIFLASLGERACKFCLKLNGKIFDIEEALKNPPVPNKKCTNKDNNGHILCRCAIINGDLK